MKILEKIISKFKSKKIVSEEHDIITFDNKIIYLTNYQELTGEDKIKVDNYKEKININNFDTLIKYTNELRDKSKDITNLLIKFLYELEQVSESLTIKKDLGKVVELNQYELLDYEIKYAKIASLYNILKDKRKNLELKMLGLLKYKEEEQRHNLKHSIEYLGFLGKDKKLKREIEERSLRNLENTLKVAIIALDYNLEVSRNSVETANNLINSLRNYNSKELTNLESCFEKFKFYKYVNELIFENKLKEIKDIENLIYYNKVTHDNSFYHDIMPFKFANVEVKIDLEKEKYKDKFIQYFQEKYNRVLNTPNTLDNVSVLVKTINDLLIIQMIYQEDISRELRNKLYEMKLFLLSKKFMNDAIRNVVYYTFHDERKYYLDIIKREYEKFIKLKSNEVKTIKEKIEREIGYNWYLKYTPVDVLLKIYPEYLKIILMVNYPNYYREFLGISHEIYKTRMFDIEYESNWDNNLENSKVLVINNKTYPVTSNYPNYKFPSLKVAMKKSLEIIYSCKKYVLAKNLITLKNGTLTFAEGITKIVSSNMTYSDKNLIKQIKFPNSLKEIGAFTFENFINLQELNCPPLLEVIDINAFENCLSLKEISFNSKLKEIKYEAFSGCYNLRELIFPELLENIEDYAFAYCKRLKSIIFKGRGPLKINYGTFFMNMNLKFENIIWPSEIEEIDEQAFNAALHEEIINNYEKLPKTLKIIGDLTLEDSDLKEETHFQKVKKLKRD